ncbi:LysR family transcriptional regulator [Pandoraea communis]|uniref:LysR family transcriptional regulator n=1 Tax=Pandoraea communis TaxID=2508297 RepID=A0A5E4YE99_9BURK|nr:LysR family transcriptional regulator [Pandoraea communis]
MGEVENTVIITIPLKYFATVARVGSFRGAAEQLFVAASAVSRQVALLEEELDTTLFERSRGRKTLKLTPAGESLMNYVIALENESRRLRSSIQSLKGLQRGEVKLGAVESFSRTFLPGFLASFNEKYPGVTYAVSIHATRDLVSQVMDDTLDAALCFNPAPTVGLEHLVEVELKAVLLVPKGHPLFERDSVRITDCAEYGLVWPDQSITINQFLSDTFAKANVRPRVVLRSNSFELLKNSAVKGLALAVVNEPLTMSTTEIDDYRYVPFLERQVANQKMTLSVRRGRNLPGASMAFIDILKTALTNREEL